MKRLLFLFAVLLTAFRLSAENCEAVTRQSREQSTNYILYTSSDGQVVTPYRTGVDIFGANIVSNTYEDGQGRILFDGEVTKIEANAFEGCRSLTSMEIPNSVFSIGQFAFEYCSSLETFTGKFASEDNRCLIVDGRLMAIAPAGLTAYSIPNSVTFVGRGAFAYCSSLASVEIPTSVTYIDMFAFMGCSSLTSVEIPVSVTSVRGYAFEGCTSLTSVVLPNSIDKIDFGTFSGCRNLTSVNIPSSVTAIVEKAFHSCSSLTSVVIPGYVSRIGKNAFSYCSALTEITSLNTTPPTVGEDCFLGVPVSTCVLKVSAGSEDTYSAVDGWKDFGNVEGIINYDDFTVDGIAYHRTSENTVAVKQSPNEGGYCGEVVIPETVTYYGKTFTVTEIWAYVFKDCSAVTHVELPNTLTSIGGFAFYGCSNLSSVEIPNSVTSIYGAAFQGCSSLTSVVIPNSVTMIEGWVFCGCTSLTSVEISNSISIIGNSLFDGCTSLESVVIPNSVTEIWDYAFHDCLALTSIVIPNAVTIIKNNAFSGCSALAEITSLNTTPPTVGENCFLGVPVSTCVLKVSAGAEDTYSAADGWKDFGNIESIIDFTVDEIAYHRTSENTVAVKQSPNEGGYCGEVVIPETVTYYGKTFTVTEIGDYAFMNCSAVTHVAFPNTVTKIGWGAFYGCTNLAELNIPNSVTAIDVNAFRYCNSLESVEIPSSVTSIGGWAFFQCAQLRSVVIPNSVTKIEKWTFSGCPNLTTVVIPNSVTEIGGWAFYLCEKLTDVELPNSLVKLETSAFDHTNLTSVVIPNSVTEMGNYVFCWCANLASVVLPNSVEEIHCSSFVACPNLASVVIPNSVKKICEGAFYDCSGLTSVVIGNSVVEIEEKAFFGCSALTEITSLNTTPPAVGAGCFNNVPKSTCVLIVPEEATDDYCEAEGWKDFMFVRSRSVERLTDSEAYTNDEDIAGCDVLYTRTFNNTNWQPLYIPFSMNYDEWCDWADVAEINNVHQFFGDEIVTVIEFRTLNSGQTRANTPYVIRVHDDVPLREPLYKVFDNKTLHAATNGTVDCSSAHWHYTLTGVYESYNQMMGKYALNTNTGQFSQGASNANILRPQRFYLEIDARDGGYGYIEEAANAPVRVYLSVDGETTHINGISAGCEPAGAPAYNLHGVKVGNGCNQSKGIVIVNGKKVLRR